MIGLPGTIQQSFRDVASQGDLCGKRSERWPPKCGKTCFCGSAASQALCRIQNTPGFGTFERYPSVWVALCMVAGIGLGKLLPGLLRACAAITAYTLVQVSVNDLIMLVLFVPIVQFLVHGASSLVVPFNVLLIPRMLV